MLEMLRAKAQGAMAWIVVLFIGIAFTFFGLGDYFSGKSNREVAAKVDGQKITWQSVDNIYKRVAPQYGNQVDETALKNQILMQLIRRIVLIKQIKTSGFRVGDEQVAELLVNIPAFQVDGQFSKEQYLKILAEANYTEVAFRQELSQDALLGQLEQGINQSSFTTSSELENTIGLVDQKRDFGYTIVAANQYKKDVKISQDKIKNYYNEHKASFVKPEAVMLEYVELTLSNLMDQMKPSKQEVLAFYEEHKAAFAVPERVHARHILISVPQGNEATDASAKKKIEAISAELKKGADFSKIAKEQSNDTGSAKNGGDLGWFVRGQMVPEFETAAFELKKPGSISSPVRTQFGYHLIQLIDHQDAKQRTFAEVKETAESQFKNEKAEALFAEKIESLAKLGFEQPSLEPVAKEMSLQIKETTSFSRQGGEGIASNPEVVKIAFSESLLKNKHNSEPIRVSDDATVVIRVKQHQPAAQETLAEAEKKIADILSEEGTRARAKSVGEDMMKKIQQGHKPSNWIVKSNVVRAAKEPSRDIVVAAFQIPDNQKSQKPNLNGFSLPNGDYLVLALNKVKQGNWSALPAEIQASYRQGLTEFSSQLEYSLYANQVLQAANIQLFQDSD